jgi:hypothetical protein
MAIPLRSFSYERVPRRNFWALYCRGFCFLVAVSTVLFHPVSQQQQVYEASIGLGSVGEDLLYDGPGQRTVPLLYPYTFHKTILQRDDTEPPTGERLPKETFVTIWDESTDESNLSPGYDKPGDDSDGEANQLGDGRGGSPEVVRRDTLIKRNVSLPENLHLARASKLSKEKTARPKALKIAIYMTTHQSEAHMEFLRKCWPFATQKLKLLQQSDLIYYTSASWDNIPHDLLTQSMRFKNVTIYQYKQEKIVKPIPIYKNGRKATPGEEPLNQREIRRHRGLVSSNKQYGAKQAMLDPFFNHWFDDYDWIFRLNPDVLIRNETWLLEQIHKDHVQAILYRFRQAGFHSDFYGFRPSVYTAQPHITPKRLLSHLNDSSLTAEHQMMDIFGPLLKLQHDNKDAKNPIAWLPGARIEPRQARLGGTESHVLHLHSLVRHCPNYFDAHDGELFR